MRGSFSLISRHIITELCTRKNPKRTPLKFLLVLPFALHFFLLFLSHTQKILQQQKLHATTMENNSDWYEWIFSNVVSKCILYFLPWSQLHKSIANAMINRYAIDESRKFFLIFWMLLIDILHNFICILSPFLTHTVQVKTDFGLFLIISSFCWCTLITITCLKSSVYTFNLF